MTALIWSKSDSSDAERAMLSNEQMYVVRRNPRERAFWDALVVADGVVSILETVSTKTIAKAVCQNLWSKAESTVPDVQPDAPQSEFDNYALEPFEPTGDEEWDRRARGAVETDGL